MSLPTPRLVESVFLVNDVVPSPASSGQTFSRLMRLRAPHGLEARLTRMLAHPDAVIRAREHLELIDDIVEAMGTKMAPRPD